MNARRVPAAARKPVRRIPVRSSSIAEIGYNPRHCVLDVLFRNGSFYRYFGVPASVHSSLLAADSIGRYMNRFVRDRYRCVRKTPPTEGSGR